MFGLAQPNTEVIDGDAYEMNTVETEDDDELPLDKDTVIGTFLPVDTDKERSISMGRKRRERIGRRLLESNEVAMYNAGELVLH